MYDENVKRRNIYNETENHQEERKVRKKRCADRTAWKYVRGKSHTSGRGCALDQRHAMLVTDAERTIFQCTYGPTIEKKIREWKWDKSNLKRKLLTASREGCRYQALKYLQ